MFRWIAALFFLSSVTGCAVSDAGREQAVLFMGRCFIDTPHGVASTSYRMVEIEEEETIVLFLNAPTQRPLWSAELGQTEPTAVYTKFHPSVGNLLVVEADEGGSMLRLVLISVSVDGDVRTIFDGISRFGFDMLNLDNDLGFEIVQTSGDLHGPKTIRIFDWDGAAFTERSRIQSSGLPHYQFVAPP